MSSQSETTYTFRNRAPQVLERGRTQSTTMEVRHEGALVAPTASGSTYTLYDMAGNTVATGEPTVTGSIATYSLSSSVLSTDYGFGEGYREVWKLVMPDGVTHTGTREVALCKYPLRCPVSQSDLTVSEKQIVSEIGGLASHVQDYIDDAWNRVLRRILNDGRWPEQIVSVSSLYDCVRELVRYYLYREMHSSTRAGERYKELKDEAWKLYQAAWSEVTWREDLDQDGNVDSLDRESASGAISRTAAPGMTVPRWMSCGL